MDLILSGLGLVTADLAVSELHMVVTADLILSQSVGSCLSVCLSCRCGPDFIRVGPGHCIANRILSELDHDFI